MVGHCDPVAGYRAGYRDAAVFNAHLMLFQIDADNGFKLG